MGSTMSMGGAAPPLLRTSPPHKHSTETTFTRGGGFPPSPSAPHCPLPPPNNQPTDLLDEEGDGRQPGAHHLLEHVGLAGSGRGSLGLGLVPERKMGGGGGHISTEGGETWVKHHTGISPVHTLHTLLTAHSNTFTPSSPSTQHPTHLHTSDKCGHVHT